MHSSIAYSPTCWISLSPFIFTKTLLLPNKSCHGPLSLQLYPSIIIKQHDASKPRDNSHSTIVLSNIGDNSHSTIVLSNIIQTSPPSTSATLVSNTLSKSYLNYASPAIIADGLIFAEYQTSR